MNSDRLSVCIHAVGSALLLGTLAICGYIGARPEQVQAVSVPVIQTALTKEEHTSSSMEEIRKKLREERNRELSMLESVIEEPSAPMELRKSALEQKAQLVRCMDMEARTEASLAYMGYSDSAVICSAESVTVFAPLSAAGDEACRLRMIDAAASQTGVSPADVKIILAKI